MIAEIRRQTAPGYARLPMVLTLARASAILPAMWPARVLIARCGLWLIVLCSVWSLSDTLAFAQHGCIPGNLIPNCDFNEFSGNVPTGFSSFILAGSASFSHVVGSESHSWYAPSSLRMDSPGTYVAGIYTQVGGVTLGTAYKASLGWGAPSAPTDTYGRQLGIDPTGGTNPAAPTVIWGPMHWGDGRGLNYPPPDVNIDVSTVAKSSTITVFIKVDHNRVAPGSMIFVDAISLVVDPTVPTAIPATWTPTPLPPTAIPPTRVPPTAVPPTATPTRTATPTFTATPTHTPSPTATHTPTITPTPTATETPTVTPSSTLPSRPSATPGAPSAAQADAAGPNGGFLFGGLGALAGAGVLAGATVVVRRRH